MGRVVVFLSRWRRPYRCLRARTRWMYLRGSAGCSGRPPQLNYDSCTVRQMPEQVVSRSVSESGVVKQSPVDLGTHRQRFHAARVPPKHRVKKDSDVDASVLKRAFVVELREETRRGDVSDLALACASSLDPRLGAHDALRHPLFAHCGLPAFEDSKDGLFSLLERHCGDGLDSGGARLPCSGPPRPDPELYTYRRGDDTSARPAHLRTQIRILTDDDDTSYASSSS